MKHDREFVHILDHFLHLYPTNNLKNQNFEKKKKNHHFPHVYQKL